MGVAADCEYTQQYGTPQNATMQILTNWNTASALYKVNERTYVQPAETQLIAEHVQC